MGDHFKLKHQQLIDKLLPECTRGSKEYNDRWNAKRQKRTLMEAQLYEIKEHFKKEQDDEKEKRKRATLRSGPIR